MTPGIVKIGSVELSEKEAFRLYSEGMYIVTYSKIYALHYSHAQQRVYGHPIFTQQGMTRRGRYHTMTAAGVNRLVGIQLVNE